MILLCENKEILEQDHVAIYENAPFQGVGVCENSSLCTKYGMEIYLDKIIFSDLFFKSCLLQCGCDSALE